MELDEQNDNNYKLNDDYSQNLQKYKSKVGKLKHKMQVKDQLIYDIRVNLENEIRLRFERDKEDQLKSSSVRNQEIQTEDDIEFKNLFIQNQELEKTVEEMQYQLQIASEAYENVKDNNDCLVKDVEQLQAELHQTIKEKEEINDLLE